MPSVSKKQHNFMAAIAKNPKFAKKVGIPRSVGEEFLTADKGKKFKEGGEMRKTVKKFGSGGMSAKPGMPSFAKQYVGAALSAAKNAKPLTGTDRINSLRKPLTTGTGPLGGPAGPRDMARSGSGTQTRPKPPSFASKLAGAGLSAMMGKKPGMKSGGMAHSDMKMDKKVVKKAVGMHEKQLHGGKKSDMSKLKSGGMAVKKMARGGGIEKKGKTQGTMIKMKRGGAC
jgi:hypothetical protein